jgi:hypothetical protein
MVTLIGNGTGFKIFAVLVWLFFAALYVGFFGGICWIAWHFIKKFW